MKRAHHARTSNGTLIVARPTEIMLEDGTYETLVVDANDDTDMLRVDLTVVAGVHKGEVVSLRIEGARYDAIALLGLPVTLVVENGAPRMVVD